MYIDRQDLKEVYTEDTKGRRYHQNIVTKNNLWNTKPMASEVKETQLKNITWKEFKKQPDDLKVFYLTMLKEKYGIKQRQICEMFNISIATVVRLISDLKLNHIYTKKCPKWNAEKEAAWQAFLNGEAETTETTETTETEQTVETEETIETVKTVESVPTVESVDNVLLCNTYLPNVQLDYCGNLNVVAIASHIGKIIPSGTHCNVHIKIDVIGGNENGI